MRLRARFGAGQLVVVAVLFWVSACGDDDSVGGTPLPTAAQANNEEALLVGMLNGAADEDGGCVWLELVGGPFAGERQTIVWPPGYTVRFDGDGGVLLDGGREVARLGETIAMGGGSHREPRPDRCDFGGEPFFSGDVTNCTTEPSSMLCE